jgi:hypothetical protein
VVIAEISVRFIEEVDLQTIRQRRSLSTQSMLLNNPRRARTSRGSRPARPSRRR